MNVKDEMARAATGLIEQEATQLEARLRELVGTGMDLAVFRSDPVLTMGELTATLTTKFTCLPVLPGVTPPMSPGERCTIYKVSEYKGLA